MKMVIAYVLSVMAPAVVDALRALPEPMGATLTKAQGFGRSHTGTGAGAPEGEFVGARRVSPRCHARAAPAGWRASVVGR